MEFPAFYRVGARTAEADGRIRLRLVRTHLLDEPVSGPAELDVIVPHGHDLDLVPADDVRFLLSRPSAP